MDYIEYVHDLIGNQVMLAVENSNIILFHRVSTYHQPGGYDTGVSALENFVNNNTENCTIKRCYMKESGKNTDRESYRNFVEMVHQTENPVIICLSWYALGHQTKEKIDLWYYLKNNNGRLLCLQPSFMDSNNKGTEMLFTIMAVTDEQAFDEQALRRKAGVDHAKSKNKYKGRKQGSLGKKIPPPDDLRQLYDAGWSVTKIQRFYKCSRVSIYKRLRQAGCEFTSSLRNPDGHNQYVR